MQASGSTYCIRLLGKKILLVRVVYSILKSALVFHALRCQLPNLSMPVKSLDSHSDWELAIRLV